MQATVAMAIVLASWPAALEPRLHQQNVAPPKIAPLTLTYGQQPPINGPITPGEYAQLRLSWDFTWPVQRTTFAIPPPQAPAPPPSPPLMPTELAGLVRSWPTEWGAQKALGWAENLPPWIPPVSNAPPPIGALTPTQLLIGQSWSTGWAAPQRVSFVVQRAIAPPPPQAPSALIWRAWVPDDIVTVTTWTHAPDNPDQPPPSGPLTATKMALLVRAWPTDWPAQKNLGFAENLPAPPVLTIPPVVGAVIPAQIQAWPRDWPVPPRLASLVQPSIGSVPVPVGPLTAAELAEVVGSWPTQWSVPQRLTTLVQPAISAPPVPQGPLTASEISEAVQSWPTRWEAQKALGQAENLPPWIPPVVNNPPPARGLSPAILIVWNDLPEAELVTTYTIAWNNPSSVLPVGDNPPPRLGTLSAAVLYAWNDLPEAEIVDTCVIAIDVVHDNPPIAGLDAPTFTLLTQAWPTNWAGQGSTKSTAWYVPPRIDNPPFVGPLTPTELLIVQAWPRGWTEPQELVTLVPPTPAAAPPPTSPLSAAHRQILLGSRWQVSWPAQSVPPRQVVDRHPSFKPEWASNTNQLIGPSTGQPETH
jgi:hypothetical protein